MKTLERSPKRLRLAQFDRHFGVIVGVLCICASLTPWITKGAIDARVFLGIAGIALLVLGLMKTRRVIVTLDKAVGIVYVRSFTVWGTKMSSAPLNALRQAEMHHSHTDENGRSELLLVFHDREAWAVRNISAPDDDATYQSKQINDWMHLHLPAYEGVHEDHPQHYSTTGH